VRHLRQGGTDRPGAVPYNEYAKMVAANIGKKTETQTQTVSTKDGDGSDDKFDESAIQQEMSSMLVGRESKDGFVVFVVVKISYNPAGLTLATPS